MHNLRHQVHNVYKSAAETLLPVRSSSAFKVGKAGGSRRKESQKTTSKSETVNALTSLLVLFHFHAFRGVSRKRAC